MTKIALSHGSDGSLSRRMFRDRIGAGKRWLELVGSIGWVAAIFADWMKTTWFTERTDKEWRRIRKALINRRHWIREQVKEYLGPDHEWMMTGPSCITLSSDSLTSS